MRDIEKLYESCLKAKYIHTTEDGDYSISVVDDTIFLFFEWSDDKRDWKNNFNFPIKPYKRMKEKWYCHRGFLKVWKAMQTEIEEKVNEILLTQNSIKNIVCVGYSHGSPLSTLATENFNFLYGHKLNIEGYGFGSPRVLWGFLPKTLKERLSNYYNIRNKFDIVSHVPPFIFGYRNSGKLIKIGRIFKYNPINAHRTKNYKKELHNYMEVLRNE